MGENYFGITDPGLQRKNNEDSFIAKTGFHKQLIVACVIDGVGGYAGGEVAAQLTRDEIIHELDHLNGNIIGHMISALGNANERIIREKESSPENEKMACVVTLVVVDIDMNLFYFAHVGDTRLYLFRDGSLIKVTKDHSAVGFLEESGRLTEEAAMQHPRRNEVNKVLGYEAGIALSKDFIDTGDSPFLPGDTILVCSDGLTDMIPAGRIISILNSEDDLPSKGRKLVKAANDAGGKDNITVVLVQNDKSRLQHATTKPLVAQKKNNPNGDAASGNREKDPITEMPAKNNNSRKGINRILLFFCFLFFFGFAWVAYIHYYEQEDAIAVIPAIIPKHQNQQEIDFSDSIKVSIGNIVRLTGGQTMVVTKAILIEKDSLHIIGNGSTFICDSAYTGPAFMLAPNCKYILLDSIRIQNFTVGVSLLNKGIYLKNVQFKNCVVPLQFQPQVAKDTLLSGIPGSTIFYFTDSVITK